MVRGSAVWGQPAAKDWLLGDRDVLVLLHLSCTALHSLLSPSLEILFVHTVHSIEWVASKPITIQFTTRALMFPSGTPDVKRRTTVSLQISTDLRADAFRLPHNRARDFKPSVSIDDGPSREATPASVESHPLDPVEPCWWWMKRRTTSRGAPKNQKLLEQAWLKVWKELPQEQIQ